MATEPLARFPPLMLARRLPVERLRALKDLRLGAGI
jgi:hypothetical protein